MNSKNNNEFGISIVICTHKAGIRLQKILERIFLQKNIHKNEYEIIIVDNNSLDDTYEIACNALKYFKLHGKVLKEPKIGKRYALVTALNHVKYSIIAIVDDDNFIGSDYLSKALDCFHNKPDVGYYGVATKLLTESPIPCWWSNEHLCYAVGSKYPTSGYLDSMNGDVVWGAGMVFRREIWFKGYSFYNSKLMGRNAKNLVAGEDSELCLLARLLGWRGYFDKENIIEHYMPQSRMTEEYLIKVNWSFGVASVKNKILIDEVNFRKNDISWFKTAIQRNRHFLITLYKIKIIVWIFRAYISLKGSDRISAFARASGYQGCVDELTSISAVDLWSFPLYDGNKVEKAIE